jgi:hypothetical protein
MEPYEHPHGLDETAESKNAPFHAHSTARSAEALRKSRETRASEALKMKDDQLRILSEQNSQLLGSLDAVEEEANSIQVP